MSAYRLLDWGGPAERGRGRRPHAPRAPGPARGPRRRPVPLRPVRDDVRAGHPALRPAADPRPRGRRPGGGGRRRRRRARWSVGTAWCTASGRAASATTAGAARTTTASPSRAGSAAAWATTAAWRTTCSCPTSGTSWRPTGSRATVLAPLADAGLTAYHAIRRERDALTGECTALVIGVGGLGHLAVQILRATTTRPGRGRRPAARGPRPGHRPRCPQRRPPRSRRRWPGRAPTWCSTSSGSDQTMSAGGSVLAPGGRLVVVGGARGSMVVGKGLTLPLGWQVSAPFWGAREDLVAVIELAQRGTAHPGRRGGAVQRPGPGLRAPARRHRDRPAGRRTRSSGMSGTGREVHVRRNLVGGGRW